MNSNNTNRSGSIKDYPTTKCNHDIKGRAVRFSHVVESTAIQCSSCDQVAIAEYNLGTRRIEVFEHDPYIKQRKVLHPHPAGPIMRKRIESQIAIETRLLHSFDEGDFHILTNSRRIN